MKKVLILLVALILVMTGSAFALLDTINNRNNSPETTATSSASALQGQNQNQGQAQGQLQGQGQLQTATAIQGQLGIVGQANKQSTKQSVAVAGDTTKVYSASYPAVGATEGVSSGTASSLFGSLGLQHQISFTWKFE